MSSASETNHHPIAHESQPRPVQLEGNTADATPESVTMQSYSALPAKPRDKADTKTASGPRLSPSVIRALVQLVSVLAFAALLVPYTQYSRMKKEAVHETCKTNAQHLYQSNLGRCDANAARNFSLRGGVLGLSWLEIAAIMGAALAWQYPVRFLQGWAVDMKNFVKTKMDERKHYG